MAHGIGAIKAGGLAPFAERFCVDGFAAARLASPVRGLRLLAVALADRLGSIFGRPPRYLPGAGRPGELAIGATADALFGERLMTPKDGTEWRNRVAARSLLSFSWRRSTRPSASPKGPPVASCIAAAAATTMSTRAAGASTTCCASRSNFSTGTGLETAAIPRWRDRESYRRFGREPRQRVPPRSATVSEIKRSPL